ncbi:MAG TPA: hypothetical protein VGM87_22570 [Roseomonas sp.]|jgi:hypothetical protein
MTLAASMAEIAVYNMLRDARHAGVSPADTAFAARTDIGSWDVASLREGTKRFKLLLIMRCPKEGAAGFQGKFTPKRMDHGYRRDDHAVAVKSGLSGIGYHPDSKEIFLSDYDLMSVWVGLGSDHYQKVPAGMVPDGQPNTVVDVLNAMFFDPKQREGELKAPFQHGAQDDYIPPPDKRHPNLKVNERCAAFREGEMKYLQGIDEIRAYYYKWDLSPFPYDHSGKFTGGTAG